MSQAEVVMRVRFKSDLELEQLKEIVETRAPEFEALAGLKQKYYLQVLKLASTLVCMSGRRHKLLRSLENQSLELR